MCVHLYDCNLEGLILLVSLDSKTSWNVEDVYPKGGVCNASNSDKQTWQHTKQRMFWLQHI